MNIDNPEFNQDFFQELIQNNFIQALESCDICHGDTYLGKYSCFKNDTIKWRCRSCKKHFNIRKGSFFEKFPCVNLKVLVKIVLIFYTHMNLSANENFKRLKIRGLKISLKTIAKIYSTTSIIFLGFLNY